LALATVCVPVHMLFTTPASRCGIASCASGSMRSMFIPVASFACACSALPNAQRYALQVERPVKPFSFSRTVEPTPPLSSLSPAQP
jgi:hypothetical protein